MTAAGGSDIGLRKDNEDSYYINEACGLLVIADGMGGHEHGQLASSIAVNQFSRLTAGHCPEAFSLDAMRDMFTAANEAVYRQQEALNSGIMGTTLTAVVLEDNRMYVGHVGDSRLYLFREGDLIQLTMDHSYYAELMRQGSDSVQIGSGQRNILLKALGPEAEVDGQFLQQTLQEGDILLLCTDGLYNALEIETLQQILSQDTDENTMVQQMLAQALERGASDNLTAIVYRHQPEILNGEGCTDGR